MNGREKMFASGFIDVSFAELYGMICVKVDGMGDGAFKVGYIGPHFTPWATECSHGLQPNTKQ